MEPLACCGMHCTNCGSYGDECPGCRAISGAPGWAGFCGIDACPVYACCVSEKNLAHCGLCAKLPCGRYDRYPSPLMTPEEHAESVNRRAQTLRALGFRDLTPEDYGV